MPTSLPFSTTGSRWMRRSTISCAAFTTGVSGGTVRTSRIITSRTQSCSMRWPIACATTRRDFSAKLSSVWSW